MSIEISFIIPHKGRIELLTQTITSILNQNFELSRIEIIVVTQSANIEKLLDESISFENLKILQRQEHETISTLRNVGVESAHGSYLAFLDADVCLSYNWLTTMYTGLTTSDYILMSAAQENSKSPSPLEKIRTALSNAELDTEVNFLPGRNLFLRKSDFYKSGRFPEHLVTCEDYYFTDQLSRLGKLYYTSKASYIHLGEDKKYHEMFKKEIWRGQSNLLSIKGRKIPIQEIPSLVVPLALMLMLVLGFFFIIFNGFEVALLLILFSLSIVLAYILRLKRLVKSDVKLWYLIKFYVYYFPARAYGTIAGIFQTL